MGKQGNGQVSIGATVKKALSVALSVRAQELGWSSAQYLREVVKAWEKLGWPHPTKDKISTGEGKKSINK